jgi:hypothetical protein
MGLGLASCIALAGAARRSTGSRCRAVTRRTRRNMAR